jgi:hypothetical protein
MKGISNDEIPVINEEDNDDIDVQNIPF